MKKTFFTLFLALCTFSCAMFSQKTASEKTIVATYNKGQITLAEAQLELEKISSKSEKLKDIKFTKFHVLLASSPTGSSSRYIFLPGKFEIQ